MAEQGNNAAIRNALSGVGNICLWVKENCAEKDTARYMAEAINLIDAALAKPARNCDVGTAQEQAIRFAEFCSQYRQCDACPLNEECYRTETDCEFAWGQMPYAPAQEGGAK